MVGRSNKSTFRSLWAVSELDLLHLKSDWVDQRQVMTPLRIKPLHPQITLKSQMCNVL